MDLRERIARRRSTRRDRGVVVDHGHLSPVVHRPEPVGHGPTFEALLDVLEPVFDEELSPPLSVVGPPGSGTSAVVWALFDAMNDIFGEPTETMGTTTRAGSATPVTWFAYVDARRVDSPFAFYRELLSVVSSEPVPESGVGTVALRERLESRLSRPDRRVVVAIDHHDESDPLSYADARELLSPVTERVSTVAVGRSDPADWDGQTVPVPGYRDYDLVDVLTDRVSTGLAANAIDHDAIRELAYWADGNAHDALAALFAAAILAREDGVDRIEDGHLERAKADVPDGGVHVDRALALSETHQRVLLALVSLDVDGVPIRELAAHIAGRSSLTTGTVTRLLYELADRGVLERVPVSANGSGRRPSTVVPRVPTIAFRALSPSADAP